MYPFTICAKLKKNKPILSFRIYYFHTFEKFSYGSLHGLSTGVCIQIVTSSFQRSFLKHASKGTKFSKLKSKYFLIIFDVFLYIYIFGGGC